MSSVSGLAAYPPLGWGSVGQFAQRVKQKKKKKKKKTIKKTHIQLIFELQKNYLFLFIHF
jgi:hypothetical protein